MSIVALEDMRAYLRFPDPSASSADDTIITDLIDSVTEVIELHTGPVVPHTYIEKYDGGRHSIFLRNAPIVDVAEVIESWGYVQFSLDQVDPSVGITTSIYAYSIENYSTAQIMRRSAGGVSIPFIAAIPDAIQVTYTAGRQNIPAAVSLACKEMVAHIYQASLQRGVSLSGNAMSYDIVTGTMSAEGVPLYAGIPNRLMAFLASESRLPVIA